MLYNVIIDEEEVGLGLSFGELNQWLIELNAELNENLSKVFMKDLGLDSKEDLSFEDYLYSKDKFNTPIKARFGGELLEIIEYDF